MATIRRILCPVDLSEASQHAIEHALALARWYGASISALHVYSPMFMSVPGLPPPDDRVPDVELTRVRSGRARDGHARREWLRASAPGFGHRESAPQSALSSAHGATSYSGACRSFRSGGCSARWIVPTHRRVAWSSHARSRGNLALRSPSCMSLNGRGRSRRRRYCGNYRRTRRSHWPNSVGAWRRVRQSGSRRWCRRPSGILARLCREWLTENRTWRSCASQQRRARI